MHVLLSISHALLIIALFGANQVEPGGAVKADPIGRSHAFVSTGSVGGNEEQQRLEVTTNGASEQALPNHRLMRSARSRSSATAEVDTDGNIKQDGDLTDNTMTDSRSNKTRKVQRQQKMELLLQQAPDYELWSETKMCKGGRWYPNAYAYAQGGGGSSPGSHINKEQAIATGIEYCAQAMADDSSCSKEWIGVAWNNGHCSCMPANSICDSGTFEHPWQFKRKDEVDTQSHDHKGSQDAHHLFFKMETSPNSGTFKDGVTIYKSVADKAQRHERAQNVFAVGFPKDSDEDEVDVKAFGALTISRCGKKDIIATASNGESNPCHNKCFAGNPVNAGDAWGGCYPWEDDQNGHGSDEGRKRMITPKFYATIHVPGRPDACPGCEWQSKKCTAREHHCTLVLPQCSCKLPRGKDVKMIVAAETGDGKPSRHHWVMELEDKGFLAVFQGSGSSTKDQGGVNYVNKKKPQFPATHDPDTKKFDFPYHHVVSAAVPNGKKHSLARINGQFTMRLRMNRAALRGVPPATLKAKPCDPLVTARFLLTEGRPTTQSTQKNAITDDFKFMLSENCVDVGSAPECTFHVADIAKLSRTYKDPYVTLAVSGRRTCVVDGEDFWSPVKANLEVESVDNGVVDNSSRRRRRRRKRR